MVRLLSVLLFSFFFASSLGALNILHLKTPDDIKKYSSGSGLVVWLTTESSFNSNYGKRLALILHDLKGPNLGIYDPTSFPRTIADGKSFNPCTYLVIKDNRVLVASDGKPDTDMLSTGFSGTKNWIAQALSRSNIDFEMLVSGDSRAKPLGEASKKVELAKDNLAWFDFSDEDDKSDKGSMLVEPRGKTSGVSDGTYYCNGVYEGGTEALRFVNAHKLVPTRKSFSFGLNVKLLKDLLPASGSVFFAGGPKAIKLRLSGDQKFSIWVETYNVDPEHTARRLVWDDFYSMPEVNFSLDTWHNIQIVVDYEQKRLKVFFDGNRFDDIVLSDEAIGLMNRYNKDYATVIGQFFDLSRGALLFGYADDFVFYNRAINAAEAKALYLRDKKN